MPCTQSISSSSSGEWPALTACRLRDDGAQHDVAEQARSTGSGSSSVPPGRGAQLVHREGQDVGGPGLVHPPDVEVLHGLEVDEQHGQLGQGVDPHAVEGEAGDVGERGLVGGAHRTRC